MGHGFASPCGGLVGVAQGARVGDFVLVGHSRRDHAEGVRVNHGAGYTFGLDLRHVTGDALTSGTAVFVVRVSGESGCVRAVGRGWAVAVEADLVRRLAQLCVV